MKKSDIQELIKSEIVNVLSEDIGEDFSLKIFSEELYKGLKLKGVDVEPIRGYGSKGPNSAFMLMVSNAYKKAIGLEEEKSKKVEETDIETQKVSYQQAENLIKSYENPKILKDFQNTFKGKDEITKQQFFDFSEKYYDDMSELEYTKANWEFLMTGDESVYDNLI